MENEQSSCILVVDDEASNIHILNQILKESYTVYAARTGKAALKIAGEKRPGLILLDVIMPDINGLEVLSKLKSSDATRSIPVIIISGLNSAEDEQAGFQLGAAGYITKPFSSSVVKEKIEQCLNYVKHERE